MASLAWVFCASWVVEVKCDPNFTGMRMLQDVADGFLQDGEYVLGNLPSRQVIGRLQRIVVKDMPMQQDATSIQHGLNPMPKSGHAHWQYVVLPIHGVDNQAQIQQALLQGLLQHGVWFADTQR